MPGFTFIRWDTFFLGLLESLVGGFWVDALRRIRGLPLKIGSTESARRCSQVYNPAATTYVVFTGSCASFPVVLPKLDLLR